MAPFYYWIQGGHPNLNFFKLQYLFNDEIRGKFVKYSYYWVNNVPLSLICRPALTSFLCLMIFLTAFIRRNLKLVIVAIPIFISLCINLLSPVNGDFRYALPVISCLPLLIILLLTLISSPNPTIKSTHPI